jgi:hypothetical protein
MDNNQELQREIKRVFSHARDHKQWARVINRRFLDHDPTLITIAVSKAKLALAEEWIER